jgi:hypothetical protein
MGRRQAFPPLNPLQADARDLLKQSSSAPVVLHPTAHLAFEIFRDENLPVLAPLAHHEVERDVLLSPRALAARLSADALAN